MPRKSKYSGPGLKPFQRMPRDRTPKSQERFSILHHSLKCSPAWLSLSPLAIVLYADMIAKYDGHNDLNIEYTKVDAIRIMDKKSFYPKRDELLKAGFIEYAEYHRGGGTGHVYKFSSKWHDYVPLKKEKKTVKLSPENGTG